MASDGGIRVEFNDEITRNMDNFPDKFNNLVEIYFKFNETKVQDYMRTNAPWTDRTGNARQGLFAKYVRNGKQHTIVAYHTMPYGIWLEVKNDGKYNIVDRTIQHEGKRLMRGTVKLLRRMSAR